MLWSLAPLVAFSIWTGWVSAQEASESAGARHAPT